ncbi:response regulator [Rhizobium sp. AB2/73]|uniref:response regulator transcription factor n=1 Tax=Rhizobium sp. AB2/73 TaxID=2795216 RepID=UPI000DDC1C45|nr:response regulator [Rhizobium sp. AB2/73]QYA17465.1 response regulator [Rhizobium sp. AB2/73]UEQ85786.1 response regulator [Rhizobium sp. AB2/73]
MARRAGGETEPLDGLDVAIVEDDAGVRIAYGDLISSYGLGTRLYSSAEDFLESEDGVLCRCLILDQRLPGLMGTELQSILREIAPALPIIFVTSQNDQATMKKTIASGARYFLVKPVEERELMQSVFSVIGALHLFPES